MALNPNLSLQVKTLDTASPLLQYAQIKEHKEDRAQKKEAFDIEALSAREKSRLQSVAQGIAEAKAIKDSGGDLNAWARQRKISLGQRIAAGENVDTRETDEFLTMLEQDPEQASQFIDSSYQGLQSLGVLKAPAAQKAYSVPAGGKLVDGSGNVIATGEVKRPNPPKDYQYTADGTGVEPILGSPTAQKNGKGEEIKQSTIAVLDRLLANESGVRANRGGLSTQFPNVSNSSINAAADLDVLKSLLTADNISLLKGTGSFSDQDLKLLTNIGAGGLQGADEQVLANLRDLKQKLSGGQSVAEAEREIAAPQAQQKAGDAIVNGKINYANPLVQQAFDEGYSVSEIMSYLGGK